MSFAASKNPIVYNNSIDGSSVSSIVSGLAECFASVGWNPTSITGGFKFTIISPQSLSAKVKLYDGGDGTVKFQFLSTDELRSGFLHGLLPSAGRLFSCWANICGTFVAIPGQSGYNTYNTSVAGTIPFIPQDLLGTCGIDIGPTLATECWWSNGNDNPGFANQGSNFRFAVEPTSWSACYNGDLMVASLGTYSSLNSLRYLSHAILPWDKYFGSAYCPHTRYFGGEPFRIDPELAWGTGTSFDSVARYRGQIYDAYNKTENVALEDIETLYDSDGNAMNFINYMSYDGPVLDKTRLSSLYLLLGRPSNASGYMFMRN